MTKIIITGSKGRMGQALISCAKSFRELEIAAQIDKDDDLGGVIDRGDVVVDFTEVDIITSSSLASLLKLRKTVKDNGGNRIPVNQLTS